MSVTTNITTLVSIFHTPEHATQAMEDLREVGIPVSAIQTLGRNTGDTSAPEQSLATLKTLNLPDRDVQVLWEGLKGGGSVIIVRAEQALSDEAETIFERYHARQIDERSTAELPKAAAASATGDIVIPVVEESLLVGKRKVEQGGVRVISRMVETPVEEQVVLREEHATLHRNAVNRPLSAGDLDALENQTIEIRETAEEAVVGKTARVVEEVSVGKEATQRSHLIHDTVRKTEIEVDQLDPKDEVYQSKG